MSECALLLGKTQPVVGIVTEPPGSRGSVGLILSNSGIVHRVGPSRVYVRIARHLAAKGFVVARIDHRGIGDSPGRTDTLPFMDAALQEITEAMDEMGERWGVRRFLVGGICLGAELAFRAAQTDDRIAGILLINGVGYMEGAGFARQAAAEFKARDYVLRASVSADSWRRALTGRIAYRRLASVLLGYVRSRFGSSKDRSQATENLARQFGSLVQRGVGALWVHSSDDVTIQFQNVVFRQVAKRYGSTNGLTSVVVPDADHTFTLQWYQERLLHTLEEWTSPFLD